MQRWHGRASNEKAYSEWWRSVQGGKTLTVVASEMGFLAVKAGAISLFLLGTVSILALLSGGVACSVIWGVGALALDWLYGLFLGWR